MSYAEGKALGNNYPCERNNPRPSRNPHYPAATPSLPKFRIDESPSRRSFTLDVQAAARELLTPAPLLHPDVLSRQSSISSLSPRSPWSSRASPLVLLEHGGGCAPASPRASSCSPSPSPTARTHLPRLPPEARRVRVRLEGLSHRVRHLQEARRVRVCRKLAASDHSPLQQFREAYISGTPPLPGPMPPIPQWPKMPTMEELLARGTNSTPGTENPRIGTPGGSNKLFLDGTGGDGRSTPDGLMSPRIEMSIYQPQPHL